MRRQAHPWSCGAASVVNAIRGLGYRISEFKVRSFSNTTKEGTSETGIIEAIRCLGFSAVVFSTNSKNEAWEWLVEQMYVGKPVILCVENFEHWISAIGICGNRITVFDPSNFKKNIHENGTHSWGRRYLMRKWYNTRVSLGPDEPRLYAISVGKK